MPTVLIIDERAAVRTALEILLSLNGHAVIAASGPEDGLRAVAAETVDIIILQAERTDEDVSCETRSTEPSEADIERAYSAHAARCRKQRVNWE